MYSSTTGILRSAVTGDVALELSYREVGSYYRVEARGIGEIHSARGEARDRFEDFAVLLSRNWGGGRRGAG